MVHSYWSREIPASDAKAEADLDRRTEAVEAVRHAKDRIGIRIGEESEVASRLNWTCALVGLGALGACAADLWTETGQSLASANYWQGISFDPRCSDVQF